MMRVRKLTAVVCSAVFFLICLLLYRMADRSSLSGVNKDIPENNKWIHVKDEEVKEPEETFRRRGKLIVPKQKAQPVVPAGNMQCSVPSNDITADIQMLEVYKQLKFDNKDGGVWKQGWNLVPDVNRWSSNNRLQVIVVPHSHNDPGWIKTFEDYYQSSSRSILNSMLHKMSADPQKKFIWAEISFFSLWWDELSAEDQQKAKKLVEDGQLEIVTGGWVMNDEANAHYLSILTQLTEGHQWVKDNLNVTPRNSWCIDPFGKSSSMPYFLKKMGLQNLVIQRVHYSIKKYMSQTKNLEFRWRQTWDAEGTSDMMTHMMPFYSYDVPHTCGPDPKVCCQFDFKRLPGHGLSCPWREPPRPINAKNVAARAQLLLDQYRKKAELYRTNALLVPLGDDFRYEHSAEWDNQFDNYYKIFEYFNSHPELFVDARFGTLEDYFSAVMAGTTAEEFPSVNGDFFTYADRDDHYWSGYFTSRPFHKRMDRVLMSYLRSAEILYALAWGSKPAERANWLVADHSGFGQQLRTARRALSLFQHHDAVAGTARDHVMEDYGRKMIEAIAFTHHVIQQATHFLLTPRDTPYQPNAEQTYFDIDDHRRNQNSLAERKLLIFHVGETKRVVFYNSLSRRRQEAVSLYVFKTAVSVTDGLGAEVACQTNPIFLQGSVMDSSRYELTFIADVPALGLASYTITYKGPDAEIRENALAKITLFNSFGTFKTADGFEKVSVMDARDFSIESSHLRAAFNSLGQLKSVTLKETDVTVPVHVDFIQYQARQGTERSGAYLFLPAGEAVPVRDDPPLIRVYEGPIISRVEVVLTNVRHCVSLYNSPGADSSGVEIFNWVDVTKDNNYELAMRLQSHVKSQDEFYTDLNGFQMIKRKRFPKLPLQANFYPMPQATYLEDDSLRVTLVTGQALGVASLKEGQIEVMQDRRLLQDDNRGLGQGVTDNRPTLNVFRVIIEQRDKQSCKSPASLLSATAHDSASSVVTPLIPMIWHAETACDLTQGWAPGQAGLPSDVELDAVRTLGDGTASAALLFHRTHLDTCFVGGQALADSAVVNINKLMPDTFGNQMHRSSLSFLEQGPVVARGDDLPICHMDFLSIIVGR